MGSSKEPKTPESSKKKKAAKAEDFIMGDVTPKSEKKKKKSEGETSDKKAKRKRSDDTAEEAEEVKQVKAKGKKAKGKAEEAVKDVTEEPKKPVDDDGLHLDNFDMSDKIKDQLKAKGIQALFPIQRDTFTNIKDGFDLVGRARTGCGKTLAFVLPVVERLMKTATPGGREYGRKPICIVLAPTRELAKQVAKDFEWIGMSANLVTLTLYGGTPYPPQENALRRGVDIVVGTPGRIKDHLERGTLNLSVMKYVHTREVMLVLGFCSGKAFREPHKHRWPDTYVLRRYRILDEADEMLNMGFVDDVEKIMNTVDDQGECQTLLFSATIPPWVKEVTTKFLKPDHKIIDLVGNAKMQHYSALFVAFPASALAPSNPPNTDLTRWEPPREPRPPRYIPTAAGVPRGPYLLSVG
eukprot:1192438-Prorocentrum_minimum.AAC.2